MEKISIVIPLYNKCMSIASTLDSVLHQTYSNFELIVVDDGSTDGSGEKVKSFHDNRIRYVRKDNGGVSSARNVGIKLALADWILLLDADDYLIEDGLMALVKGVERNPNYKIVTDSLGLKHFWSKSLKDRHFTKNRLKDYLHNNFVIRTGNTLFHRDCFDQCGYFDERLALYEDYKLFLKMIVKFPIAQIRETVFAYETDFCGLSAVRGLTTNDYLYYLEMSDSKDLNKCLYSFLASRFYIACLMGDKDIIEFIQSKFSMKQIENAQRKNARIAIYRKIFEKIVYGKELIEAFLKGKLSFNKKSLLAKCPSRYGKFGVSTCIGNKCCLVKASKVFLYDNVCIGDGLLVENERGKFIVRSNSCIGKNLYVKTSGKSELLNVVIGKNVVIGDNVKLGAGTYIKDGSVIHSNSIMGEI